jgi:hypothetical protein
MDGVESRIGFHNSSIQLGATTDMEESDLWNECEEKSAERFEIYVHRSSEDVQEQSNEDAFVN